MDRYVLVPWMFVMACVSCTARAPQTRTEVPPAVDGRSEARRLVDDALAAKGGREKLTALTGIRWTAEGTFEDLAAGRVETISNTRVLVLPDRMHSDSRYEDGTTVTNIIGPDFAVLRIGDSVTELRGPELAASQLDVWRDPDLLVLRAADPEAQLEMAPDETVDGQPCAVVKLRGPDDTDIALYVDRQTKLVARVAYLDRGEATTIDMSDYRDVGGVKFAYRRVVAGPTYAVRVTYRMIVLDPAVDPAELEP